MSIEMIVHHVANMVPLGVLRNNKSLSMVLWIQIHENRMKKLPVRLADSRKHLSVNWMAAQGFFSFFQVKQAILSL